VAANIDGGQSDDHMRRGGEPPIAYFSENVPGAPSVRLAAAVAWRGVATRAARYGGGGPLGWLRGKRHRLWLRLGPLGADVSVNGRTLFGGRFGSARSIGSVEASAEGVPLAFYDDETHALRLLGRVVTAPPERTLVALVDATGRRAHMPRLVLRLVTTPPMPVSLPDFTPTARAVVGYFLGGDHPMWEAALRADPVVRAFLDGPRDPTTRG
jgi:hypothetical protein